MRRLHRAFPAVGERVLWHLHVPGVLWSAQRWVRVDCLTRDPADEVLRLCHQASACTSRELDCPATTLRCSACCLDRFVRSITMDKWSDDNMRKMKVCDGLYHAWLPADAPIAARR